MSVLEDLKEIPDLVLGIFPVVESPLRLFEKELAVALTETVEGHLDCIPLHS